MNTLSHVFREPNLKAIVKVRIRSPLSISLLQGDCFNFEGKAVELNNLTRALQYKPRLTGIYQIPRASQPLRLVFWHTC